jgi:hypothetical protein
MPRKKQAKPIPVESVKHRDKRANIPTQELRDLVKDDEAVPSKMLYPRDPSLDPQPCVLSCSASLREMSSTADSRFNSENMASECHKQKHFPFRRPPLT